MLRKGRLQRRFEREWRNTISPTQAPTYRGEGGFNRDSDTSRHANMISVMFWGDMEVSGEGLSKDVLVKATSCKRKV
jgi:hypothetical protein